MSIAKELEARLYHNKISYEELYAILQKQNLAKSNNAKSNCAEPNRTGQNRTGQNCANEAQKEYLASQNNEIAQNIEETYLQIELLRAQGLPLESRDNAYFLAHNECQWREQEFCFVDIETTGSKPDEHQIIEIGAIKWKNGKILGRFEELIYACFVPETIIDITHITPKMLENARKEREVLRDFRAFLAQSVFVAHNVGFDYGFVSVAMEQAGLYKLLNPKLCTIDLARKTILAKRYSLSYLNEFLGINTPTSHRAYADAFTALKVFEISLMCLPNRVRTTQDLIDFSKNII